MRLVSRPLSRIFAAVSLLACVVLGLQLTAYSSHCGEHAAQSLFHSPNDAGARIQDSGCAFCAALGAPSIPFLVLPQVNAQRAFTLAELGPSPEPASLCPLQSPPARGPPPVSI